MAESPRNSRKESMTEPPAEAGAADERVQSESESGSLTADSVAAWLEAHPDFLVDRAELAERLELPAGDEAVSLTEYRSRRLVEENERLRQELGNLGNIAGENERLMRRLHELTLALSATENVPGLFDELARRLREDFRADTLRIRLPDTIGVAGEIAVEDVRIDAWSEDSGEVPDWLQAVLDANRPECGRMTSSKRDWLFGDDAGQVGSAALVPFATADGQAGLLAIGAEADDRFQPGLGTLFLELLGETLAGHLRALSADRERRRRA